MSFMNREWTDFEKWGMGILAALIVAAIGAFWTIGTGASKSNTAFLVGYESAIALAKANKREDTSRLRAKIQARLGQLGIAGITIPKDPAGRQGGEMAQFINTVKGMLSAQGRKLECALEVGFAGFVEINTPGTFPDFDLRKTAECAGFLERSEIGDKDYLTWLFKQTGENLEYK